MIVGIIRRKPVLTHASIIFGDMLASVNSVKKSVEILSAAAQLYEKSHLTRRIALSCGIKISPVCSLD